MAQEEVPHSGPIRRRPVTHTPDRVVRNCSCPGEREFGSSLFYLSFHFRTPVTYSVSFEVLIVYLGTCHVEYCMQEVYIISLCCSYRNVEVLQC